MFELVTRSPPMSTPSASRTASITIADLLSQISSKTSLADRQDICSAIRTLCRALGQAPADVPADLATLRRQLKELTPLAAGVSRGRWRNIKSLLSKPFRIVGIPQPRAPNPPPLT